MKQLYFVRHCKATGQHPEAPLTEQGRKDTKRLVEFLLDKQIEVIISSPYTRAIKTIEPFAQAAGKPILVDERLRERVLSSTELEDWMEKLGQTYDDLDLKFEGGESSREAMGRGIELIHELSGRPESRIVLVTHGAILSLILKYYTKTFGFEDWLRLTNPAIYRLELVRDKAIVTRMWTDE